MFLASLAERIEEALGASSREPSVVLASQLTKLFAQMLQIAPERSAAAVRGEAPQDSAENVSFLLGQVAFAQRFAAQASDRLVNDTFVETLRSELYIDYVRSLVGASLTNKALAARLNVREETVSRKLRVLRMQGICDYRKQGTEHVNFLTPPAKAAVAKLALIEVLPVVVPHVARIQKLAAELPHHFRKSQSFASSGASEMHNMSRLAA